MVFVLCCGGSALLPSAVSCFDLMKNEDQRFVIHCFIDDTSVSSQTLLSFWETQRTCWGDANALASWQERTSRCMPGRRIQESTCTFLCRSHKYLGGHNNPQHETKTIRSDRIGLDASPQSPCGAAKILTSIGAIHMAQVPRRAISVLGAVVHFVLTISFICCCHGVVPTRAALCGRSEKRPKEPWMISQDKTQQCNGGTHGGTVRTHGAIGAKPLSHLCLTTPPSNRPRRITHTPVDALGIPSRCGLRHTHTHRYHVCHSTVRRQPNTCGHGTLDAHTRVRWCRHFHTWCSSLWGSRSFPWP